MAALAWLTAGVALGVVYAVYAAFWVVAPAAAGIIGDVGGWPRRARASRP